MSKRQSIEGHAVSAEERAVVEDTVGKLGDVWIIELRHKEPVSNRHLYSDRAVKGIHTLNEMMVVATADEACAVVTDWLDCCDDEVLARTYKDIGLLRDMFSTKEEHKAWQKREKARKAELEDAIEHITKGDVAPGLFLRINLTKLFAEDDHIEEIIVSHELSCIDETGDPLPAYFEEVCKPQFNV